MCALFCIRSKNSELFEFWCRFRCSWQNQFQTEENHSIKEKNDQIDEKNNQDCFCDSRDFSFRFEEFCCWILELDNVWCFETFRFLFRWFQQTTNSFDFRRFFSFSFHRNETSTLIAFLSFELIRINRNLAKFKKKCIRKFLLSRKK